jgi:hypothetical protein
VLCLSELQPSCSESECVPANLAPESHWWQNGDSSFSSKSNTASRICSLHSMSACMHWMPRHTHTFPFFLKSLQLFFGDSGVHVHVYRRICTVTVPFSLIPHPFSYKSPLISHSFTASTHFLPRDVRPIRGRPDTSDMFPASIATTLLRAHLCARAHQR